ncbi:diguanylate cyclase [Pseudothauera nasutitermitis]|nr:diguanylate cyclase [Pseudothauera nasutitermitis]
MLLRHVTPRSLAALLAMALACLLYWLLLLDSQRGQLAQTEAQARLRATQMSATLAIQVETLVTGLEHLLRSLSTGYMNSSKRDFEHAVRSALTIFPPGSISQIGVADAQGRLVYFSQSHNAPPNGPATISVADRDYFHLHATRDTPRLHIAQPLLGRVSGQWVIPFSYPLLTQDGRFAGVVALSVSPDYISGYFREVLATNRDVAVLLLDDGAYLARSSMQNDVLTRRVPPDREFLRTPSQRHGEYRLPSPVDGVERYYAWHRVTHYPLVVSIGLDREHALQRTRDTLRDSLWRNVLGTVLILCAALWIVLLFARQHRNHELLAESGERHKLALEGGSLGSWDWDVGNDHMIFDPQWCAMLGYAPGELAPTLDTVRRLAHPDDRDKVLGSLDAHVRGQTEVFEAEHRVRHRDGRWIWVHARGRATHRTNDGLALRVTGTQADISQRVTETLLRRALLDNTGAAIFLATPERSIRFSNQRAIDIFSDDGRPLDGRSMRVIHCDDNAYETFQVHYRQLREGGGSVRMESRLRTRHDEIRWFNLHGTLLDPVQPDGDVIWTMIDVTERRRAEEALSAARGRLGQIIEHFPGGILVENEDGRVVVANQTLCDLFATTPTPAAGLIGLQHAALRQRFPREVLDTVLSHQTTSPGEALLADGRSLHATRIPIRHATEGVDQLWIVHDVTEQRRHEQTLERLASTDTLTGLANRHTFLERLEIELARIARGGPGGMVAMLDLDHFKRVNDGYGHAAGDAVLVHLAGILRRVLRREDMAARLGGEEFALLLPGTDAAGAATLGERLRSALEHSRIETFKGDIHVTTSIGLAPLAGDARTLLARADAALYQAKNEGRNRVAMAPDEDVPA